MSPSRPTLHIDLAAARANWRRFAALAAAGGGEAGATIKADAYGLGAGRLGPAFAAEGCRTFFVANADEGAALRDHLTADARILVYNGPAPGEAETFRRHSLLPVLNAPHQIETWLAEGAGAPAALHIDTGMNRLGLTADEARALAAAPPEGLALALVMSHLACADEPDHPANAAQLQAFSALSDLFPDVPRSLANSGGALLGGDYQFDLTRPGIGLYGGQPAPGAPDPALKPVASIQAPILQTRRLTAGDRIGYGGAFAAGGDMTVAIVALGYADGLIRAASHCEDDGGAYGVLTGRRVPLAGRVSMDLAALDVTGLETAAKPGAQVTFLGDALEDAATAAGTISYELLTRLGGRLQRVWSE